EGARAEARVEQGAAHVAGDPASADVQLIAIGAYQLEEALRAQAALAQQGRAACVTVIIEPGRLRSPRDELEASFVLDDARLQALFPPGMPRVILTHTRPEPMLGILRRIDSGPQKTRALGYISRGGTLYVAGKLRPHRCTSPQPLRATALVPRWNLPAPDQQAPAPDNCRC